MSQTNTRTNIVNKRKGNIFGLVFESESHPLSESDWGSASTINPGFVAYVFSSFTLAHHMSLINNGPVNVLPGDIASFYGRESFRRIFCKLYTYPR
jgi:hypothetical protein